MLILKYDRIDFFNHRNRVVTIRYYDGMNYDESKKSFEKAKKECYAMADKD